MSEPTPTPAQSLTDGGWPDADDEGTPPNQDRTGWHWLGYKAEDRTIFCKLWLPGVWLDAAGKPVASAQEVGRLYRYLGPCLTPAEHAQAITQAREEGAKEMQGRAMEACERIYNQENPGLTPDYFSAVWDCRDAILSLTPTPSQEDRKNG